MRIFFLLGGMGLMAVSCQRNQEEVKPVAKTSARFEAPVTINIGEAAQFYDRSTNASSYAWTWGDGTTGTGPSPSHRYERTGRFRVRLQATGPGGQDTTSSVVQVSRGAATLLPNMAGTYRGRLFYYYFLSGNPPTSQSWQRDTTLQLRVVNSTTISFLSREMSYSGSPNFWLGHAPVRSNFYFNNNGPASNNALLQIEQAGDSIYFKGRTGGLAGGTTYTFFGVKQR